jgi:hypothetical protein
MKTEDLIQRLGTDPRPVRPLGPPWQRASLWLAAAIVYVLFIGFASWLRHGALRGISSDPGYVIQQLALVGVAIAAAVAAFTSVIPGVPRPPLWTIVTPAAVLMVVLVRGMVGDVHIQGTVGLGREMDWPCVGSIMIGTAALWLSAMAFLRRGAALSPAISGLLAGLAAVSLANVEACLTRAHAFSVTVLVWHGATSVMLILAALIAGRRVLSWARLPAR